MDNQLKITERKRYIYRERKSSKQREGERKRKGENERKWGIESEKDIGIANFWERKRI